MTYNITIMGYGDEPYEQRRATELRLLAGLVSVLAKRGGTVLTFTFAGNEVKVNSFADAIAVIETGRVLP